MRTPQETVHFARLDGADIMYLATRESRHYLRPFSRVGRRLDDLATSLGKAILAERTDAEVEKLLPPEMPALSGDAIDNEEGTLGLRFGMALRYEDAISCSVPIARLSQDTEAKILDGLAAWTTIERALRTAWR